MDPNCVYKQTFVHKYSSEQADRRTPQLGAVPPTLHCPDSSSIYSKGCYDTEGDRNQGKKSFGAIKTDVNPTQCPGAAGSSSGRW